MKQCRFCTRWFRNRQGVRRHLGYCVPYGTAVAEGRAVRRRRVTLWSCAGGCGFEAPREVVHDLYARSGCPGCGVRLWNEVWRTAPA